ncbi:glutamate racemase [Candidatus Beckwithbacteria bacterium CG10_big_fil_rev_8_21_14_0_10_34_10]|uniref:Glutamate racemase n=1 Tax=Candidatus Beckwithbacteria bacterium CG10_big_fil_rev_8_21_14_0_10_34_10 TaxID=1974495 RepID=A0A2H0W904_9BACT|nr:MAG: glutamate racemase [Candidatus Beckwithbacteria bacterium CG10_big_fil_rev_8_21_14_0_10_34_10]
MFRPIAILDSGLGGLTILKSLYKILPLETYVYLADQKNCPYGERKKEEIESLSQKACQYLLKFKPKIIVIACNTITTESISDLREKFKGVSFVGVVPPVKLAVKKTKTGHFIILSTKATQKGDYLKSLIKDYASSFRVYSLSGSGLVKLIESGQIKDKEIEKLLEKRLSKALKDEKIDTLATGCTHYPLVKKQILAFFNKRGKQISFIEPGTAVANQVKRILAQKKLLVSKKQGKNILYTTLKRNNLRSLISNFGFKMMIKEVKY